jgi:methyltransferase (TIGR00027 family)
LRAGEPSQTAMMTALGRGLHRQERARPWVLDDPFALPLIGPGWPELYAGIGKLVSEPLLRQAAALTVARSRYAEDRLNDSFAQYVVLGAGLDSFAWRRPDLLRSVRVFEVDHPATQDWKRERVAELALPCTVHHIYVPLDFETATLRDALSSAGLDWSRPTLYSWLGVTGYIAPDAVEATLRVVAGGVAGSEIVMGYAPTSPFLNESGAKFLALFRQLAAQSGEPMDTVFSPSEAEAMSERCGLSVVENIGGEELHERYFADRSDGLAPLAFERYLTAAVT